MQFLWPLFLWGLLLVPILLAVYLWTQRRRRRYALRYSTLLVLRQAVTPGQKLRRHIPAALFLLGLAAMLLAMARPQTVVVVPQQQQTVILAIDVSGSMRTRDIYPSRIEAAKAAARTFVQQLPATTRVGLVAFSGTASIVQAPTTDRDAVIAALDRLVLERSTAIGSGILASLNAIYGNIYTDTFGEGPESASPGPTPTPVPQGAHVAATVVLLTDGANVQGPSPIDAAQKAADLGVRIFTIGVGDPHGSSGRSPSTGGGAPYGGSPNGPPPYGGGRQTYGGGFYSGSRFEVDETTLKSVAEATGGEYFLATNANALKEIYQKLNSEVVFATQKTEVTALFTALGALSSIAAVGLAMVWFNRVP